MMPPVAQVFRSPTSLAVLLGKSTRSPAMQMNDMILVGIDEQLAQAISTPFESGNAG